MRLELVSLTKVRNLEIYQQFVSKLLRHLQMKPLLCNDANLSHET